MEHVLIIADIEGSSGCWKREASELMTAEWAEACLEMSLDIDAVAGALFDAGVKRVTVKDFHRTAYNLLPHKIDPRARIVHGYRAGPVPGIGDPDGAGLLMLIGMHAASGSSGFLAHTLTSRIERLEVNGRLMAEVELFCASLAPFGLRPVFFSGCPVACAQAAETIKGIACHEIDKSGGAGSIDIEDWRAGLAHSAVNALDNAAAEPYAPPGPFNAVILMRDGEKEAAKIAGRWGLNYTGSEIHIKTGDIHELYYQLIRICYLTPFIERFIGPSVFLYNLYGRLGQSFVRFSGYG